METSSPPVTGTLEEWDTNPSVPVVAARVRHMSHEEWMGRATALAWKRHTIGQVVYLGTDRDGVLLFAAPSYSMPGHQYQLHMDISRKQVACPCTAASFNYPCAHIGALFLYLRQLEMAMGPRYTASFDTGALTRPPASDLPETAS